MPKYTVKDSSTGKTITFDWQAATPPTDADMEEVFKQAQGFQSQQAQPTSQPAPSFMQQRFPYATQGIEQAKQGNPIAGGLNLANQAVSEVFRPITIANQYLRQVPVVGKPLSNIAMAVPEAISTGYDLAKAGLNATGIPDMMNNLLPVSDKTGSQIAQAGDIMNKNIAMLAMPDIAAKAGGKAVKGLKNIQQSRNLANVAKAQAEIKKVAPPTPKELNYDKFLNQATPYITKQLKETPIQSNSDVSPIRQATDIVAQAKSNLWNEQIAPIIDKYNNQSASGFGQSFAKNTIDGTQVANAIRQGLTDYTKNHDPLAAKRIEAYAASFDGKQIPIGQANQYITELNARTSAYQKAPPIQKTLIENASPNISSEVNAVDALREQVYAKLDELGAPEVRGLKKDYGALMQVHKALERKIVPIEKGSSSASFYGKPFGTAVAAGATMEGLIHSPKTTMAAGTIGLIRKYITERNKPNPTIERAFGRLEKSTPQYNQTDITQFPVNQNAQSTPNVKDDYSNEAKSLGIKFDNYQPMKGGVGLPQFTDPITGTTFYKGNNETLTQALKRVRTKFGIQ